MTTEQHSAPPPQPPTEPPNTPGDQPGWGAPQPQTHRPQWTKKRTVIAVAVAVGIAAAGGGVIYAASGTSTDGGGPGRGGGPGGGVIVGGPMMDGLAQHGQFQNGEVTEITDTSITVESEDGYTGTYTVDDDTEFALSRDDVDKGDKVNVMADQPDDGDTPTAISVFENTGDGVRPPNGPGRQGPN